MSETEWDRPSTKRKMWTQKATARRLMIQPATETGRKTGPKGLNQGMGSSALASISEQPMGYFRNLKGYAGRDDPKVDGRYTIIHSRSSSGSGSNSLAAWTKESSSKYSAISSSWSRNQIGRAHV